jgi:hypothetical protein
MRGRANKLQVCVLCAQKRGAKKNWEINSIREKTRNSSVRNF